MLKEYTCSMKITPKINGVFASVEHSVTYTVAEGEDVKKAKQKAWDECYDEVYKQIEELQKLLS